MTTSTTIFAGAIAPEAYTHAIVAADLQVSIDLATVTAVKLKTRDPDGNLADWAATFTYDTVTQTLTATHTFAAPTSEVTNVGTWSVYAELTVSSGTVRDKPRGLIVLDQYAIT